MAMLPFKPTPFFSDKNRAFWLLQIAGWGGAMLLRTMSALAGGQDLSFLVLIAIASITGFSLSLLLSVIYRKAIDRRAVFAWSISVSALATAVILHALIDSWVLSLYRS